MTPDEYLISILKKYQPNTIKNKEIAKSLCPIIGEWAGDQLKEIIFSGSIAKGTQISISTDADLFISLTSTLDIKLEDIYNSLYDYLHKNGYNVRKQNVSIGVKLTNGNQQYKIDLIPARRQSQYGNDHSLFKNKSKTWTQTDISKHISIVSNSNRINEIKLLKIWRELNKLEFPSLYLELIVIKALNGCSYNELSKNFQKIFVYIKDNFQDLKLTDPSNTNNIISDDLFDYEKTIIINKAEEAIKSDYWNKVVY